LNKSTHKHSLYQAITPIVIFVINLFC